MTGQDTSERMLDPLAMIDVDAAMAAFEEAAFGKPGIDHSGAFFDVASAAMQVSVEIAWPTIRRFAQKLRDEGPMTVGGWRFAPTTMSDAWQIGFTADHPTKPGGWLYNCVVEADESPEGLEERHRYREKRKAEGATAAELIMESLDGERTTRTTHPEFFLPQDECQRVSDFWVCAYASNGGYPDTYEGYGSDDLETIKGADFESGYIRGAVIHVDPSWKLALDFGGARSDPDIPASSTASNPPAGFAAMDLLSGALRASGLLPMLQERAEHLSRTRYDQYGDRYRRTLYSIGAASAYRSSMIGIEHLTRALTEEVWAIAAAADATHGREDFAQAIRLLEAKGHVSTDAEYPCNDQRDFSFIERLEANRGILWVRTQHGQYRVDFTTDEKAMPINLTVSAQHEPDDDYDFEFSYESDREVSPGDEDFLALFRWDESKGHFVSDHTGPFHIRTIKDLNNVLLTLRSVSCCLEGDYPDEPGPHEAHETAAPQP